MIAVLTGDLVHSTKLSSQDYANTVAAVEAFIAQANRDYQAKGYGYRGDAFQLLFPTPAHALPAALMFKLSLQGAIGLTVPSDCTLSLGYGEPGVDTQSPSTSTGEAYVLSGRNLDKASRGEIVVAIAGDPHPQATDLLCRYLSHQLSKLTQTQSQLLHSYIQSGFAEHRVLAEQTHTSRQNISQRLSSIGAELIESLVSLIHANLHQPR